MRCQNAQRARRESSKAPGRRSCLPGPTMAASPPARVQIRPNPNRALTATASRSGRTRNGKSEPLPHTARSGGQRSTICPRRKPLLKTVITKGDKLLKSPQARLRRQAPRPSKHQAQTQVGAGSTPERRFAPPQSTHRPPSSIPPSPPMRLTHRPTPLTLSHIRATVPTCQRQPRIRTPPFAAPARPSCRPPSRQSGTGSPARHRVPFPSRSCRISRQLRRRLSPIVSFDATPPATKSPRKTHKTQNETVFGCFRFGTTANTPRRRLGPVVFRTLRCDT